MGNRDLLEAARALLAHADAELGCDEPAPPYCARHRGDYERPSH